MGTFHKYIWKTRTADVGDSGCPAQGSWVFRETYTFPYNGECRIDSIYTLSFCSLVEEDIFHPGCTWFPAHLGFLWILYFCCCCFKVLQTNCKQIYLSLEFTGTCFLETTKPCNSVFWNRVAGIPFKKMPERAVFPTVKHVTALSCSFQVAISGSPPSPYMTTLILSPLHIVISIDHFNNNNNNRTHHGFPSIMSSLMFSEEVNIH